MIVVQAYRRATGHGSVARSDPKRARRILRPGNLHTIELKRTTTPPTHYRASSSKTYGPPAAPGVVTSTTAEMNGRSTFSRNVAKVVDGSNCTVTRIA